MIWIILLILKGLILYMYLRFLVNVSKHRKQDPTLRITVDFISVIELASVAAISAACLISSLSAASLFICVIAFIDLIILYFESKRVILIGEDTIQIREELVAINDIIRIETSLWTLHVYTKDREIKVMNPLVTSWQFQEHVYKKLKPKYRGSRA